MNFIEIYLLHRGSAGGFDGRIGRADWVAAFEDYYLTRATGG